MNFTFVALIVHAFRVQKMQYKVKRQKKNKKYLFNVSLYEILEWIARKVHHAEKFCAKIFHPVVLKLRRSPITIYYSTLYFIDKSFLISQNKVLYEYFNISNFLESKKQGWQLLESRNNANSMQLNSLFNCQLQFLKPCELFAVNFHSSGQRPKTLSTYLYSI